MSTILVFILVFGYRHDDRPPVATAHGFAREEWNFPLTNVRKSLAKGTAWIAGARLATNILGFISTLVLARLLTPSDFGLVAIATTMLAILTSVTELSLTSALVQLRDPTDTHYHAAWTLQLFRGLLLAALFIGGALPAAALFGEPRLAGVMAALAVGILIQGFNNPRSAILTRSLIFWQQFVLEVGSKLAGLIVGAAVAIVFRSYWALVCGALAGQATYLIASYVIIPFLPRFRIAGSRDLFAFSAWLTLGQIINTINWKSDQLFIGAYLGKATLGFYTVGDNLAIMPTREATTPITQTLFPAFSRLREDDGRLAAAYQRAQSLVTAIALPAGVGMATIAHPLVLLAMGEKWLPAVAVIQALAAVFAFQTLGSLSQPLAMATGNTRLLFRRDLQGFMIRLPTIVAGMLIAGLPGIIYARVLTGSIAILLHMQVVRRITGLSFRTQLSANVRSIASVVAMAMAVGGVLTLLRGMPETTAGLVMQIALAIVVGGMVYAVTHAACWLVARRPDGPEAEVVRILGVARHRLFPRAG